MTKPIKTDLREANLRREIRAHLRSLGFSKDSEGRLVPPDLSKETYRRLHEGQRKGKFSKNMELITEHSTSLLQYIASGDTLQPKLIRPRLEIVEPGTVGSRLFRFASLYWRVPVSDGYGRRIRFLVWDDHNGKLIGLIGLGDPVFNLGARDRKVGWSHKERAKRLVNVMDAFVLGAVPPYSYLLGGKLVASLVRTKEVASVFREKYANTRGVISKKKKNAKLVAVTTSSALGRSSIYNRLKLGGVTYYEPIGFTQGWGHFHFPDDLFDDMRAYLVSRRDKYSKNNRFGQGPNWRFRAIRQVLDRLGLGGEVVHHGLQREVFLCQLADNAIKILSGKNKRARYSTLLTVAEVAQLARDRWIIPRANRNPDFRSWRPVQFLDHIMHNIEPAVEKKSADGKSV